MSWVFRTCSIAAFNASGDHPRSIFDEGHRLTAPELVEEITGIFEIHLAVVTRDGTPLVAPVDAIMFIVHGVAREIDESDELWTGYESLIADLYIAMYGRDWINWYEQQRGNQLPKGFTGYIEPRAMFAKR